MAKVTLNNVWKTYSTDRSEVVAVQDINLEVNDREFVVFVGPSGCGKSTTLRMIAGLEEISRGQIFIDGKLVNDLPPKDRDIAMVFQNYALYPHMSVFENLAFALKLRRLSKQEIEKRVKEAAAILGIGDYLGRKPKALSGGQRQRVAIGRAIVRKPKVFLFDEPLSNLDAKMRVQMRAEIAKLHQTLQATMIYVTHDQVEAMTMADRIVVLKDGIIQQTGDPAMIYSRPQNLFVAGFIGSPPMNFIPGKLETCKQPASLKFKSEGGDIECNLDDTPPARNFIGRDVILGIRPEDLDVAPNTNPAPPNSFAALVDIVERLGAEANIRIVTGHHMLVYRGKEPAGYNGIGHRLRVKIDPARTHLFDPAATTRLG